MEIFQWKLFVSEQIFLLLQRYGKKFIYLEIVQIWNIEITINRIIC